MARPKRIDFSSDLKYCDTKQFSTDNPRHSVVSTDLSTNDEMEMTHRSGHQPQSDKRDVEVIVLRDRSNLSLALRKFQCGSECLPLPGEVCCECYKKHSSAISFISTSSCRARCEKCHHQVSSSQRSNILFNSHHDRSKYCRTTKGIECLR